MKKQHIYIILTLALILVLPSTMRAQENDNKSGQGLPIMLREKLGGNIGQNENVRNQRLENRGIVGSSTKPFQNMRNASNTYEINAQKLGERGFKDGVSSSAEDIRNSSSTQGYRAIQNIFIARKEALSKQLGLALSNLKQIRERINTRIGKAEQVGDDMIEAKRLLTIADGKIASAEQALAKFNTFTSIASSTATTTIDMNRPRQIADTAIKASKDAHNALADVVRAIAHAMGLDLGEQKQNRSTSTPQQVPNNQQ